SWGLSASRGSSWERPPELRAALRAALRLIGLWGRPANGEQSGSSTSATSPAGAPRLLGPFSALRGQRYATVTASCFAVRGEPQSGPVPETNTAFVILTQPSLPASGREPAVSEANRVGEVEGR